MITKAKAAEAAAVQTEALTHEKAIEGLKHSAETATAGIEQVQVTMKEGVAKAMKTAEQMAHFSQGNMEAMMKSSQIWATGLTDISKLIAASAKASMDETVSTFKAMTTVKSLKEALDLQQSFARASMQKAMTESGRVTEHSLKVAEQAFAPLTARVNAAVETFS